MFKLINSSFSDIKTDLEEYVKNNNDMYGVLDSYEGSAKTMIIDLLSGFASFLQYKYTMLRDESYLYSAKLRSSVYLLARHFGYRVNRDVAPTIQFKYTASSQMTISSGFELGKLKYRGESVSITYFGVPKILNFGDFVEGYLGVYHVISGDFTGTNFNESIILKTSKSRIDTSVDNALISLYLNDIRTPLTTNLEDFILRGIPADQTGIDDTSEIWVFNREKNYGTKVSKYDTYRIEYLESFGYFSALNAALSSTDFQAFSGFTVTSVLSYGFDKDTISKIKELVPLYYTTLRRMVTKNDHKIISKSFSSIVDTNIFVYPTDRTSINIYYIAEGSGEIARELTVREQLAYTTYLDQYKLLDLKIKTIAATPLVINLHCSIKYFCGLRDFEDYSNKLETYITNQINLLIDEFQLKFDLEFSINTLMIKIGQIKYNNMNVVKEVYFKQIVGDTVIDLNEESTFTLEANQYYFFKRQLELACV